MRDVQLILTAFILFSANCSMAQSETIVMALQNTDIIAQNAANRVESNQRATTSSQLARQTQTPGQLIKEIYVIHAQDTKAETEDRIVNNKNRRYLDEYFDKNLANLIWNDLTMHQDEIGVIDFDLFYATQDPQITNLRIGQAQIINGKATIRVTFNNAGAKETVIYLLTQANDKWKIADIKYSNGESLLKYFKNAGV
jgi:hypothetical protein